ncbi:unnamed protein product [Sphagnum jensenii]|uniref:Uncharacterized protein n=1 Tax=Sphagnum jensenii TaxID=128206 RepID=A0ABP1AQT0_9BRYO
MQQQRRLERRLLMSTYNHIYGLFISGLQFFTIYAPGTGHVWLCIFNLGTLVLQTLLPTLVDILEKYLNLKSKREIVKMPCDGDVPFTNANNISAAQA